MKRRVLGCVAIAMIAACGGSNSRAPGGDGGGTMGDGGSGGGDGPSSACIAGLSQCSNCIDDDGDGKIDGWDIECTGAGDSDEATFELGIPDYCWPRCVNQDCFFDGDGGSGNDGCNIHVCCLLGATSIADCPVGASQYDPKACPPPIGKGTLEPWCIDNCSSVTPPGCDCFGCCTVCDPVTNQCYDVTINRVVSPECTEDALSDPTKCKACTKSTLCEGGACGGDICTLCPGQEASDLPADCNGMNQCPRVPSAQNPPDLLSGSWGRTA
jgi:hypothetical protein